MRKLAREGHHLCLFCLGRSRGRMIRGRATPAWHWFIGVPTDHPTSHISDRLHSARWQGPADTPFYER
jgi:hypothetical protein